VGPHTMCMRIYSGYPLWRRGNCTVARSCIGAQSLLSARVRLQQRVSAHHGHTSMCAGWQVLQLRTQVPQGRTPSWGAPQMYSIAIQTQYMYCTFDALHRGGRRRPELVSREGRKQAQWLIRELAPRDGRRHQLSSHDNHHTKQLYCNISLGFSYISAINHTRNLLSDPTNHPHCQGEEEP
jgi:hypothetical protein